MQTAKSLRQMVSPPLSSSQSLSLLLQAADLAKSIACAGLHVTEGKSSTCLPTFAGRDAAQGVHQAPVLVLWRHVAHALHLEQHLHTPQHSNQRACSTASNQRACSATNTGA